MPAKKQNIELERPLGHELWRTAHLAGLTLKKALDSDSLKAAGSVHESICVQDWNPYSPAYHAYTHVPLPDGDGLVIAMREATDCADGARLDVYRVVGNVGVGHTHLAYSGVGYDLEALSDSYAYETAGKASRARILELTDMTRQALDYVCSTEC